MFESLTKRTSSVPQAFDGHTLQLIIGLLAITLPVVLYVGNSILAPENCGNPLLSAISAYFHSQMGTYFTGVLFAISMAMFAYKGEMVIDRWLANFSAVMAIIVAIFPTGVDKKMALSLGNLCLVDISYKLDGNYSNIHYAAAILLFMALTIFCFLFRMYGRQHGIWKRNKNLVFLICAITMIVSMIFMGLYSFDLILDKEWFVQNSIPVILIGETICLFVFGVSWLVQYTNISDIRRFETRQNLTIE